MRFCRTFLDDLADPCQDSSSHPETTSPRTRSKLTRPVRHLQSEQWMLESCETKEIMVGSKAATPGDETTKLIQAQLPQDGMSEEE